MTPLLALAGALGVTLGVGAWALLATVPRYGAPRLARRAAPYLADLSEGAREVADPGRADPGGAVLGIVRPVLDQARFLVSRLLGGDDALTRRLRLAGSTDSARRFRERQVLAILMGVGGGGALAGVTLGHGGSPVSAVVLVTITGVAGALVPEALLARRVRERRSRIEAELPATLDLLSLTMSAGLGVADALDRVGSSGGELAHEFRRVVADTHAGVPLPAALSRAAQTIGVPAFDRAIEQLIAALHRGAPLAEVLRAQAADARSESRQQLIEVAGKKEVAMLVPLVLLILPITIAFALAPAVLVIEAGL